MKDRYDAWAILVFAMGVLVAICRLEHRITVLERIAMDFTIEFRYKSHFPAVGEFGTIQLYKEDAEKVKVDDGYECEVMPCDNLKSTEFPFFGYFTNGVWKAR